MNKLEQAKKQYNEVEIPQELNNLVHGTIQEYEKNQQNNLFRITKKTGKYFLITAASIVACFTLMLNTSEAFAKEMEELPVIGKIAKILTVRTYEEQENGIKIEAKIPGIELSSDSVVEEKVEAKVLDVNQVIQEVSDRYTQEARQRAEEYKKAFLETGGTEEEWKEHDIQIKVDYEILYQDDTTVSFLFMGSENWTSAYAVREYYNIDLKTGEDITLRSQLGDEYEEWVNQEIMTQMEEQMKQDSSAMYWVSNPSWQGEKSEIDGFNSVTDQTKFYVNQAGNVVVVFDKYEVGPGSMGSPEFEIVMNTNTK